MWYFCQKNIISIHLSPIVLHEHFVIFFLANIHLSRVTHIFLQITKSKYSQPTENRWLDITPAQVLRKNKQAFADTIFKLLHKHTVKAAHFIITLNSCFLPKPSFPPDYMPCEDSQDIYNIPSCLRQLIKIHMSASYLRYAVLNVIDYKWILQSGGQYFFNL